MSNEEQNKYWNDKAGPKWVENQEKMDAMLAPVTDRLLAAAKVNAGDHVLDVGCGTGQTSQLIAEQGALVTGIDLSETMLDVARSHGTPGCAFVTADASTFKGEQQFDRATSRFGVMFFDDPVGAFENLHENIRHGGKMVFACWREPKLNPWAIVPAMAVKPFLEEGPAPDPLAPGPFAFAQQERLQGILKDSGFSDVTLESFDFEMTLSDGRGAAEATDFACKIGPGSRAMEELQGEQIQYARDAISDAFQPYVAPNGKVSLGASIWIVSATA